MPLILVRKSLLKEVEGVEPYNKEEYLKLRAMKVPMVWFLVSEEDLTSLLSGVVSPDLIERLKVLEKDLV